MNFRPSVVEEGDSSQQVAPSFECGQLGRVVGLRRRRRDGGPPWQTLKGSMLYPEPVGAVQLCRSLRFRGAYLYYAAAEIQEEQVGAAPDRERTPSRGVRCE